MDATETAEALVEWALETCPALKGSYDFDPSHKDQPLPDIAAYVSSEEVTATDPSTGIEVADLGIQQAELHVMRATLLMMVDPEPADTASQALQGFVRDLAASLKADQTLGGRVPAASPRWQASYEPPFVQFEDGSEGRAAYFSLAIAELD